MEVKTLDRFLSAQDKNYREALSEISNGRKLTHWMWYVFPQISGLGTSDMAKLYAIENFEEAQAYFNHPVLGKRLVEIADALLKHKNKSALEILGSPDDLKLHSSMTLFSKVDHADPVFDKILHHFYDGTPDQGTLAQLEKTK